MENRFSLLLERYCQKIASREEVEELMEMIRSGEHDEEVKMFMNDRWDKPASDHLSKEQSERLFSEIRKQGRVVAMKRSSFKWVRVAAAAAIIGFLVLGLWYWQRQVSNVKGETVDIRRGEGQDVAAPASTKAMITLADGRKVALDSITSGILSEEGNVKVVKKANGEISYEVLGKERKGMIYNTLVNPRGSKVVSLILADGTKVWLNAESTLKYPTAFMTNTREVEITGEAFFEVKHYSKQPFKVHLPNGSIVEDIGTMFNVNCYPDETDIKTTLIEGSVKVIGDAVQNTDKVLVLQPSQQAVINRSSHFIRVQDNVKTDQVTSWVNGMFYFENTDMETMMRQIGRWYDVEVEYQGMVAKRFGGKIPRTMSAKTVFKILEETGGVHFKIEGRRVIVLP
jgi:transmembrane sensor